MDIHHVSLTIKEHVVCDSSYIDLYSDGRSIVIEASDIAPASFGDRLQRPRRGSLYPQLRSISPPGGDLRAYDTCLHLDESPHELAGHQRGGEIVDVIVAAQQRRPR